MKLFLWIKPHSLKVILTLGATLLIFQYWRHVTLRIVNPPFQSVFSIQKATLGMWETENMTIIDGPEESNSSSSRNSSGATPLSPKGSWMSPTKLCPPVPPGLSGPIKIITTYENFSNVAKLFGDVRLGGKYKPKDCKARYKVAIIIPYRDRPTHLSIFLNNIHRMLMKQQIDYQIFVIEQDGSRAFNRGKLLNIGFVEASKMNDFDCFIFHDVDLIPEDDRNLYTCPEQPRHMSVAVDKFKYKLPYVEIFGGVCAFTKEHFRLVNGFSNSYWGWGGEDDDMYTRLRSEGLHVSRYPPTIARYTMLSHTQTKANPHRHYLLQKTKVYKLIDGLNNLKYEVKTVELRRMYTWFLVNLHIYSWFVDFWNG